MKKNLFIIFFCGATMVFTSCVDTTDNPVTPPQEENKSFSELKEEMMALYGENKKITDGNYDKSLAVKCINGTFVGKRTGDVIAHKGIPFVGQQPVGELRWKAPVDVVPDDGVYEAYYNGKSPCQDEGVSQRASLYPQGEDCLYLNVWRAADGAVNKPVMVWIHGGAFEIGGTVEPREEGTNFVKENPDVILVSVEYRLNVFGFLHLSHLPDGADYPDAQNLGLMDQLMALKWVHENIAAFDGNPDNVTIFGESAGAGSVTLLPLVKGSQQYFKRVIAESGAPVFTRSTEEAIACTNELMAQLGCSTVADLQKVEVSKLVAVADGLLGLRTWAERDGNFLPLDPYEAYANGAAKDIDLMHGCNKDEMNYFVWGFGSDWNEWAADRKAKKMAQMTDEEKALVESFCNDIKGEPYEYTSRLFDQLVFIAPLFRLSENQTKAGGNTYNYFFTVESSVPLMKCGHAVELSTVFNHPEQTFVTGRTFDDTFSKTMRRMWVQFAKTGNPSLSATESPDGKAKEWPLYDLENKQLMIFDELRGYFISCHSKYAIIVSKYAKPSSEGDIT